MSQRICVTCSWTGSKSETRKVNVQGQWYNRSCPRCLAPTELKND